MFDVSTSQDVEQFVFFLQTSDLKFIVAGFYFYTVIVGSLLIVAGFDTVADLNSVGMQCYIPGFKLIFTSILKWLLVYP